MNNNTWEEDFYKEFPIMINGPVGQPQSEFKTSIGTPERIIKFISKQISEAEKRGEQRVVNMIDQDDWGEFNHVTSSFRNNIEKELMRGNHSSANPDLCGVCTVSRVAHDEDHEFVKASSDIPFETEKELDKAIEEVLAESSDMPELKEYTEPVICPHCKEETYPFSTGHCEKCLKSVEPQDN